MHETTTGRAILAFVAYIVVLALLSGLIGAVVGGLMLRGMG